MKFIVVECLEDFSNLISYGNPIFFDSVYELQLHAKVDNRTLIEHLSAFGIWCDLPRISRRSDGKITANLFSRNIIISTDIDTTSIHTNYMIYKQLVIKVIRDYKINNILR